MAQTNDTRRSYGYDGKLYHQDTGDEDLKYRTVTENDNIRDHMRSLEMTKSLEMMNGKIDSRVGGNPTRPKSASYVPPKLGTTSKSKRAEKRAWEKEMGLTQQQQTTPPIATVSGEATERGPETNDQKLLEAITTLQNKYEENLHVIEQLFLEKKEMTKKVEVLEFKLQKALSPQRKPTKTPSVPPRYSSRSPPRRKMNQTSSSMNRYQREDSSGDEAIYERQGSRLNLTSPGLLQQHKSLTDETFLHGGDESLPEEFNNNQISALEAAQLFAEDEPPVVTSRSTKSFPTRSVYEPSPHRDMKSRPRPSSAPKRERYSTSTSPTRGRNAKMGGTMASSVTRSSSLKRTGPSPHIQADTDRYLQKKQFLLDEEMRKKQKEKEEELEREKRRQRAIQSGTAPNGMFSREEMIRQKRLERQQKNQNKNEDEFFRTQQEFHREKLRNTRIRLSIDPSKTWDDIKREEEVKRKDRIERRKEELQQTSHYSESLLKSVEKWKTMKSMEEGGGGGGGGGERMGRSASVGGGGSAGSQQFSPRRGSRGHVPSPEEVTAHLKRQQEKWEKKVQQQKLLLAATKKDLTPVAMTLEFEKRHEEYLEKRKKKTEEKRIQEENEKKKKDDEEKKRREKLIHSHPMGGGGAGGGGSIRLTKAMEERVKAVKMMTKKKEDEEKKEKLLRMKQEKKLQETSQFLKSLIRKPVKTEEEKENDLKRMVQEGREAFKTKYKQNQQAIKNKLTERPSLIERHDQAVAIAAAGTSALNKVATAVQAATKFKNLGRNGDDEEKEDDDFDEFTKKLNWKSKAVTDDIFDEEEKIQLGLRE